MNGFATAVDPKDPQKGNQFIELPDGATVTVSQFGIQSIGLPDGGGTIKFQDGPRKEFGVNGCQIDAVLECSLAFLRMVNRPPHACRENSLAITNLEQCLMWLRERTRKREAAGTEGTNKP